jgi:positive regulator of sigma E activity
MTARGVVASSTTTRVAIELVTPPACRGCHGLCLWRQMPATQVIEIAAQTPLAPGDAVVVGLPPRYLLLGTLLMHGLPLAALLGGALLGLAAGRSDLAAVVGAVAGLAAAWLCAGPLRRRLEAETLRALAVTPARGTS